ncbi:hypothetical protein SARC_10817 [Sphaeroforma arctica JP610]|uniref:Uncharacterized protein n=1 Tax=Sphaeroforma arctica JP610 TaxID=667725 RepID=A0A0L0FIX0_9EUKA|nr:hypothetical protein SARC_10817 [Sphaeroforma arctica JP610]KNC76695.1 hypothetical protein SARC_10817 [Sphaeroforma arctica JP610]|eukprot:XP_014150597.1 hypothetical protein SARC_10817 [Sphaeroforma arctica JP610]
MGMNVLALARSADTEKTFEECYKESIDTYGTLQLDGYSLPPRWTELMVVYEGTTENVTLDAATEFDRQTHAAACADECHLLTIGNLYELKNEERDGKTAPGEENFKQLYFKDDHPCTDGQEITYKALVYEKFVYQQMGCMELINEGDESDFEDIADLNAHRDQICTEGTECSFMSGILGYQINGWHDMIRTCESQETVDNAKRQKEERDQREARADSDIASGVYNGLTAGVYTVPNYKTLRSKLGDTGFEYNNPVLSERMKVVVRMDLPWLTHTHGRVQMLVMQKCNAWALRLCGRMTTRMPICATWC